MLRAQIGKYATVHGVSTASNIFSRKVGQRISEATVRSIRDSYTEELKCRRKRCGSTAEITELPERKRGRHVLLGEDLDRMVQSYLKKVREEGGVVTARITIAAARGILLSCDRGKLMEFGGHVELTRDWAYSILSRMGFVLRKASTAKSRYMVHQFKELKKTFLDNVRTTVEMEEIPPELVLNWDQTGIKILPTSLWTMEKQGSKRVEITGASDKRQITAVFCCSLVGDFLPIQLIYHGKTNRCHPKYQFPAGWSITHSPKHWSNEQTMLKYIDDIIIPYVKQVRCGREVAAVVIMDNFKGQITEAVLSLLDENDIHICLIPANTTDLLQPLDISVNKPAKQFLKNKFEDWYADQILHQLQGKDTDIILNPVDLSLPALKELGAKWLTEMAHYISNNPQFITNGFLKAGIPQAIDGEEEEDTSNGSDDLSDEDFSNVDNDDDNY